jgi:hypothetical protein
VPLFSSKIFLLDPLHFWGCLFFHQRSFCLTPCILGVPLFLSEVFLLSPLHFRGAFFLSEVFVFDPLHFWGASFFDSCLFSLWAWGLIARLRSWFYYLVPRLLSNMKLTLLAILTLWSHRFWGIKLLLLLRGT